LRSLFVLVVAVAFAVPGEAALSPAVVRSVTETSIIFMIPMPPTIKEIEAIPVNSLAALEKIEETP